MMSGNPDSLIKILTEAGIALEDARFDMGLIYAEFGDDKKALAEAVEKRASGMPVAYIIGKQGFYKEEYKVTPDVLIPRADTELLVESALRFLGALDLPLGDVSCIIPSDKTLTSPRILDLCTGTGCVGISVMNTLIEKYEDAHAVLADISDAALRISRENIMSQCRVPSSIDLIKLDVLEEQVPEGKFDVVTSNPPYINESDMRTLDREVNDYEPHLALAGGKDGLIFYPHICNIARQCLKNGGALIVEHGYDQADEVRQTLTDKGFNNVKSLKDFGGNDRVTFGLWGGE